MAKCHSCGARITWLVTPHGVNLPVDEDPDPKGNIVVTEGTDCRSVRPDDPAMPRYMPHWATCPQTKEWRS